MILCGRECEEENNVKIKWWNCFEEDGEAVLMYYPIAWEEKNYQIFIVENDNKQKENGGNRLQLSKKLEKLYIDLKKTWFHI